MKAVILSIIWMPKKIVLMQIYQTNHDIEWEPFSLEWLQRRAVYRKVTDEEKNQIEKSHIY